MRDESPCSVWNETARLMDNSDLDMTVEADVMEACRRFNPPPPPPGSPISTVLREALRSAAREAENEFYISDGLKNSNSENAGGSEALIMVAAQRILEPFIDDRRLLETVATAIGTVIVDEIRRDWARIEVQAEHAEALAAGHIH